MQKLQKIYSDDILLLLIRCSQTVESLEHRGYSARGKSLYYPGTKCIGLLDFRISSTALSRDSIKRQTF